jgi:cellulose synthase/poly-beta-1,6-N-acetylglucosamine synthase-like glycosyltransferase
VPVRRPFALTLQRTNSRNAASKPARSQLVSYYFGGAIGTGGNLFWRSFSCSIKRWYISSTCFTQSGSKKGSGLNPTTIVIVFGWISCSTLGMMYLMSGILMYGWAKDF